MTKRIVMLKDGLIRRHRRIRRLKQLHMFNLERWQEIFEAVSKNKLCEHFLRVCLVASGIYSRNFIRIFSPITNGVRLNFEQDATNRIEINT
jgi:putative ABC transport system permease protein